MLLDSNLVQAAFDLYLFVLTVRLTDMVMCLVPLYINMSSQHCCFNASLVCETSWYKLESVSQGKDLDLAQSAAALGGGHRGQSSSCLLPFSCSLPCLLLLPSVPLQLGCLLLGCKLERCKNMFKTGKECKWETAFVGLVVIPVFHVTIRCLC